MPSTSGTFNFQSIQVELIVREAFERIGILGEFVESQKLDSAKRSIDLLLLEWQNRSVNLWTLQTSYLPLVTSQAQYTLPVTVSDIVQANIRTSTRQLNGNAASIIRQLNGTPEATGGVAANAFDGNPLTSCDQNADLNGSISYDYGVGVTQTITIIGITSFVNRLYTITVQTSVDNINWTNLFIIPPQNFVAAQTVLFNVPVPLATRAYRILENGNAVLNITELYFENNAPNPDAGNAFDGNPATACIQDINNGIISYDYGVGATQQITFIGITANIEENYTLAVETSLDNINWTLLFNIPPQTFLLGVNVWFDVPTPISARAYRIREFGGQTLNIQEIYFNNNLLDLPITDVSRYEYLTYPNKQLQGRPNIFYLDRQIVPVLNMWPVPSNLYNCLQYSYKKMIQDVGTFYTNAVQVPSRFYPALVWGLSWHLAMKFNPQIAGQLQAEYEKSFILATQEDSEGTPINIYGDYSRSD